jgi:hypothetical protein
MAMERGTGGEAICHTEPRFGGRRIPAGSVGILRRAPGLDFVMTIYCNAGGAPQDDKLIRNP